MRPGLFSRAAVAAIVAAGSIGFGVSAALGDQVVLRDGTVYNGTVVSQTRREVVIDTEISGIRTRLTLDRRQIQAVTIGEDAPADEAPATPDTPADMPRTPTLTPGGTVTAGAVTAEKKLKREGVDLIVEIPMSGTFGQDIYPLSIAEGLEWAAKQGATDIVFRMNSPGGEVWAAEEIVEVMAKYSGKFRYHALIEHAISATIWPAFNCDTITMAPGATFGGAVVFRQTGTGSAEVDLKMTSIMAAKLAASAESKGHSPHLVRAMMLSESAVYAVQKGGKWELVDTEPPAGVIFETIDGPQSVLTLTDQQAGKYGIVTVVSNRDISTFAEAQDFVEWDHSDSVTGEMARKANDQCKRLRNEIIATIRSFISESETAKARNSASGYGSAIQNMNKHLGRYKMLMRRAENLQMAAITDALEQAIDVPFWEDWLSTRMADLRRERRLRGRP